MHTDNMILMWQVEESVTMGGAGDGVATCVLASASGQRRGDRDKIGYIARTCVKNSDFFTFASFCA
jgi:hypothetical protein